MFFFDTFCHRILFQLHRFPLTLIKRCQFLLFTKATTEIVQFSIQRNTENIEKKK